MEIQDPIDEYFAAVPRGLESVLAQELRALGAGELRAARAGVSFAGPLEVGYRACLWSRTASRVLLVLRRFAAPDEGALYRAVRAMEWEAQLEPAGTLAVDCTQIQSPIRHTHYAALRVKDAVVDRFREGFGMRPSVHLERPDVRIHLHLHHGRGTISVDLSGGGLHRRGYRGAGVAAPLKENLAAGILFLAGWPPVAAAGGTLLDPMCGSGTLPVEAGLMAGDIAPGLLREYFGFLGWRGHRPELWARLVQEARARRDRGLAGRVPVIGWDADAGAVRAARANVEQAGLAGHVRIERRALEDAAPPPDVAPGLVVANPPYGERLGEREALIPLYARLGEVLADRFAGWRAAVLAGNPDLAAHLGLPARRTRRLYNGPIACALLELDPSALPTANPRPFANRLQKNLRTLGRWARREGLCCYRLYDADMPEYALAVDVYRSEHAHVHVQEYEAPPTVDPAAAAARLRAALAVIPEVLDVPPERVHLKHRRRQRGARQYLRREARAELHEVVEGGYRLLVNFTDYLDTGLFLDHRLVRALIGRSARDRDFLNLFAYTGTATVYAAGGGARSTTTVDLSKTYLDWARRNLALNGFKGPEHRLVRADCMSWLEEQGAARRPRRYGLIFLDPPTFSTSRRMGKSLDVQRDHAALIRMAMKLLAPGGELIFSNNYRKFRMDRQALAELHIEDITRPTLPKDFARNPRIHNCWRITRP
ncbi:MAG: bifunctional 23S rRNA (guanine(2069)-N(7))-methyltransferase RlmK/23S rRNA (guanine(2445)-N(2))-methyltransferase RlmL [Gammaproteobacteria bacterium]|nr:bifunctional 23S rRNA (guanine(2069)-N(7))-methyltransferase RlmK/23S rRNA (guanine(2445)-N(2))-methyltransferase RlmL [Gammaproteobacteria bacterium]NIR99255.1 bifunctional 23S rRNA (guanine(2069)-N(7))-methyltransferase RlmK/23S rRNA (guanine(2445)-N(2))-methyltransferase RlmL [Gammaproteobacteria bacterium]NIT64876.1 bifunctional 23S rRNA (guanine(2069)-N(7))-methyltransferase RlmK/23S rRNA (guanine(2445)-N(2))-methyltransferase RlmL [Gammaproteobacteria bacterium]NIV21826.1 bifunctional 2